MTNEVTTTIDAAYREIIIERQQRAINPTFLTLYTIDGTAHSFESNIRLDAMNQYNRSNKAGNQQVCIYRFDKKDITYKRDPESELASVELLEKQRSRRPVGKKEVPVSVTKEAKRRMRVLENTIHAATASGEFGPDVRKELIGEFLETITCIGGQLSDVAEAIDEILSVD